VNLEETRKNWTALGESDAMWVVLTNPAKKGNRWTADDFFATGKVETEEIFARLQQTGTLPLAGRALDFGCGLGRLTQALAARFDAVDGVDISSSMIRQAVEFNKFPGRVKYHLNARENLQPFADVSYDFVCSMISLQHIPGRFQQNYIRDFLRVLKPGGVACFQTIHAHGWRTFIPEWSADLVRKWRSHGQPFIPLYGIPVERVNQIVRDAGGVLKNHENSDHLGWESRFMNDTFIVKKL
jgi:SAM-dependent methyltransferase